MNCLPSHPTSRHVARCRLARILRISPSWRQVTRHRPFLCHQMSKDFTDSKSILAVLEVGSTDRQQMSTKSIKLFSHHFADKGVHADYYTSYAEEMLSSLHSAAARGYDSLAAANAAVERTPTDGRAHSALNVGPSSQAVSLGNETKLKT